MNVRCQFSMDINFFYRKDRYEGPTMMECKSLSGRSGFARIYDSPPVSQVELIESKRQRGKL